MTWVFHKAIGFWLGALALVLGLAACAHVEAPPGGPPDKIPPYVQAVYPPPGQVGLDRKAAIQVQFSEWIKTEGLADRVVISPSMPGKLRVESDGSTLILRQDSLWREGTTYRLLIPTSVKDMAGLGMDSSFRLEFSTGAAIDSGRVQGRVFQWDAKTPVGVWAALYPHARELALPRRGERRKKTWPDSLPNPWREKPLYVEPCDSSGHFHLQALAPGRYGILAFVDGNQNRMPDHGEAMALGAAGIKAGTPPPPPLVLRLAAQDTSPLRVGQVAWEAASPRVEGRVSGALRVKFTRAPVWRQAIQPQAYALSDTAKGEVLRPQSVSQSPDGEAELWFPRLTADTRYRLKVHGLLDERGFPLDTSRAMAAFEASSLPDSAATTYALHFFQPNSGRFDKVGKEATLLPEQVLVRSIKPISDSALGALARAWNVRLDTLPLAVKAERYGPYGVVLRWPASRDSAKTLYVGLNPVRADTGKNAVKKTDTAAKAPPVTPLGRMELLGPSRLGSLKTRIDPAILGWTAQLTRQNGPEARVFRLSGSEMKIDSLVPGIWRLSLFADQNGDGLWFAGDIYPWRSQEPAVNWPDTIEIGPGKENGPLQLQGL